MVSEPNYQAAIAYAIETLNNELPPFLTYHSAWHTTDDVLPAAMLFAQLSGVSDDEQRLLEVAAAFHDIGFVYTLEEHEHKGVEVVGEVLPQYRFSAAQITHIQNLILATRLPQSPQNLLEMILADADLDLLGRDDFFERNRALRQELENLGKEMSDKAWYEGQLKFLEAHKYFTATAEQVRGEGKRKHILEYKKLAAAHA